MGEVLKKVKGGRFIGWYLRFVDADGKRKQRASGQPTFAEAKRMLAEIEGRIARGKLGVPEREEAAPVMAIGQLAERYLTEYDSPKIRDREAWERRRRYELTPFLALSGRVVSTAMTRAAAERVRNTLIRKYKANSAATVMTATHHLFSWALDQKLVAENPFAKMPKPKREPRVEFLTRDEVHRLIAAADAKTDLRSSMFAVAIRLGLFAGLRAGEIFGLRWVDIDFGRGSMTVRRSFDGPPKSGKPRPVPMPDELAQALAAWQQRCPATAEGVVCPVTAKRIPSADAPWTAAKQDRSPRRIYAAAGIKLPAAPYHCLRHTYASTFIQGGGSVVTLQKLLGHADITTTMVYAHLDDAFVVAEVKKRLSY